MDTIQYYHDRLYYQSTYAVDINFTSQNLLDLLVNEADTLYLNIGKAKVHPNDNYVKEIGREVSKSKMEVLPFILISVEKEKDKLLFTFHSKINTYLNIPDRIVEIRTSSKSQKPHLIKVR
jgi:hypothetical protein